METWWKSRFAPHDRIHELAAQMAGEIKAWNRLKGLSQADFTAGITKVYVMANHTHPFPEGNGRSTQTLLSQLSREAGYELRFSNIDKCCRQPENAVFWLSESAQRPCAEHGLSTAATALACEGHRSPPWITLHYLFLKS